MATIAPQPGETRSAASKRIRKIFGNIHEVSEMPNLIEVQRESYEQFLRSRPQDGYVSGLEKTLRSVFPIRDFAGTAELDFVNYELEDPKYDVDECRQRGMTYAAPMRVTLRLIVFEVDRKSTRLNSSHANISYAVFCLKTQTTIREHRHRDYARPARFMHDGGRVPGRCSEERRLGQCNFGGSRFAYPYGSNAYTDSTYP